VNQLKSLTKPGVKFCAVVKANAYGHGAIEIVNILKNAGVDFFAVASIYEALHIKTVVNSQQIMIFEPLYQHHDPEHIITCARNGFHCNITSMETLKYITEILRGSKEQLKLHINIETGMGRCGVDPDQAMEMIRNIEKSKNTILAGIYTHFATADEDDLSYAYAQLECFNKFLADNQLSNRDGLIIHAANSAATIKMPQSHFDMVRCGISTYGYFSRPQQNPPITLMPVMKLQAPLVQFKRIKKGESVSYGRSFIAKRDMILGLVSLGYADGYWRCFSNTALIKVNSDFAKVTGRVCMDQILVDVTDIPNVKLGQMVTVLDDQQDSPCNAYSLAELANTICYEILTCVHSHVKRIVY